LFSEHDLMPESLQHAAKKRQSIWRSRRTWVILLAVIPLASLAGYLVLACFASGQLQSAIDEADALDPGWRVWDLEAGRRELPENQNSAVLLAASGALLPGKWPSFYYSAPSGSSATYSPDQAKAVSRLLEIIEPQEQLPPEALAILNRELKALRPWFEAIQPALAIPWGNMPLRYNKEGYDANLSTTQRTRTMGNALRLQAILRAQDNDLAGALESARGILQISRSVGDEPFLVSMLIRMYLRRMSVQSVERLCAQGEPAPASLADLEEQFMTENTAPLYLIGLRGERARLYALMEAVRNRTISFGQMQFHLDIVMGFPALSKEQASLAEFYYLPAIRTTIQAAVLHYMNRQIEAAKLPPEEQVRAWADLAQQANQLPWLAQVALMPFRFTEDAFMSHLAHVRCLIVLLAAERFRQARGHWPEVMEDMVPEFLPARLLDPFTAKPLIMRRTDYGLIIYSVSSDGQDNGGNLAPNYNHGASGSDVGVRLWDPAKRRQPSRTLHSLGVD
jgi:hypothetical protein